MLLTKAAQPFSFEVHSEHGRPEADAETFDGPSDAARFEMSAMLATLKNISETGATANQKLNELTKASEDSVLILAAKAEEIKTDFAQQLKQVEHCFRDWHPANADSFPHIENGVLEISGQRKDVTPEGAKVTVNERSFAKFSRKLQLSKDIDQHGRQY